MPAAILSHAAGRRKPLPHPKLKQELDNMERQDIIKKVDHHTDWCSSLTTTVKKDGSLRVCLDPRRLNQSLKRCPHKIPTLEEITPAFAKAKYFSKLDAKAGYWSVPLAESSQELTTFRTPFGRFPNYHFQTTIWSLGEPGHIPTIHG